MKLKKEQIVLLLFLVLLFIDALFSFKLSTMVLLGIMFFVCIGMFYKKNNGGFKMNKNLLKVVINFFQVFKS